jgi:hypothetical protein
LFGGERAAHTNTFVPKKELALMPISNSGREKIAREYANNGKKYAD